MLGKTVCIGVGSMGGALLRGALSQGILRRDDVSIVVRRPEHRDELVDELGVTGFVELPDMAQFDTIILAVKPQVLPSVLSQLTSVKAGATVISVAAGVTLDTLRKALPTAVLYRAMPNTPASIGCGMTALTADNGADTIHVEALFNAVGEVAVVSEADLDRLGALSGAGPGYMFVILDALADAAGKMALESGTHPAILRDQVTSPGGTTIAGIGAMEKGGLRSALQDGVVACLARSNELGK